MALTVKPIEASTSKWERNAVGAATEFAANATAAADKWATNTKNAGGTFHQAITAANIRQRFERGVSRAGASKFSRKISDVAETRYGPGISAATVDYRAGAEPYYQVLAGLTLDQRKPRGDPSNYRRVEQVGKALNAKRLAGLGS